MHFYELVSFHKLRFPLPLCQALFLSLSFIGFLSVLYYFA